MTESAKTRVHMIGNAHIDPVWLWPCQEGREEVVATYHTAIDLIREYDAYVFTSGGSITYKWAQEDDPCLFQAIVEAVKAGKWSLVNGWWLQPDCNIPHGEAFARHALYGQRYLQDHFGQISTVGYNVDSFGHAGTLPQLLQLSGMDSYLFFRPDPNEKDLPIGPFWWESPDGSRVLTCRPPLHYNSPEQENMRERVALAAQAVTDKAPMVICFYGVGNHGGGPTKANVADLVELMGEGGPVEPVFSSPDRFFAEIKRAGGNWPVVHDELQHHSRGCYTALARIKRENRRAERALMQAERLGTLAKKLCGLDSVQEQIDSAWEPVLFNQFHDILAGTSIESAYKDVWAGYDTTHSIADSIRTSSLAALTACVSPTQEEDTFVIWNPLAWNRQEVVHLDVRLGGFHQNRQGTIVPTGVIVRDEANTVVPAQIDGVEFDDNRYIVHISAVVTVPALGWKTLAVEIEQLEGERVGLAPESSASLENEYLKLTFGGEQGWLASITDKATGTELLSGSGAIPLIIDDPSDTWSHDVVSFRDVIGEFELTAKPQLISRGPAASTVRIESVWGDSAITQEYTLAQNSPYIDIKIAIDWHEQLKMLKLAFPINAGNPVVNASAPYGATLRQANGEEEPCQAWVDVLDSATGTGIAFINDSTYGYDALGGEFRLSLLRSPIYAFHRPRQIIPGIEYHYTDQGEQIVHLRLLPHIGQATPGAIERADYALHEPLLPYSGNKAVGTWPSSGSLLRCEPNNIVLSVIKEDSQGHLIVRGVETAGLETELVLISEHMNQKWTHPVRPYEIWTLCLKEDGCQALDLLDRPLEFELGKGI